MKCVVLGVDDYPKQKKSLTELGQFLNLSVISYQDCGNGENYTFVNTEGKRAMLKVGGNKFDGGFMNTEVFNETDK